MLIINKYIIYALLDPRDNTKRYIGKSCSGIYRIRAHGSERNLLKLSHLPVVRWIKKLNRLGLKYNYEILQVCMSKSELLFYEKFWIAKHKELGASLLNCTEGGDGMLGHKPSLKTREKRSKSMTNVWALPGFKESMILKASSIWTPEKRSTQSKITKSLWARPDYKKKVNAAMNAPSVIKSRTENCAKYWNDSANRLRASKSHGGKPFIDTTTGKIYQTQCDASRLLKLYQGNIGKVLRGDIKTTGGHSFRYLEK